MSGANELWPLHPSNVGTGLPLEGVRILDLSRVLAGPLCAMVAGDLGADVIKVEAPSGDPVRQLAPPRFGEDATYYLAVNRHRRNVVADLTNAEDRRRVEQLLDAADAVIDNFLPDQAEALGINEWRTARPDLVWVTVTSASSGGPVASTPTFDLLAQARSGLMSVTGELSGPPTKVGAPVADVITGLYATIGLLAALLAKSRGAPTRHVEAPLLESTITALVNQVQGYLVTNHVPSRLGNDHPSIAPYGPVNTADGPLLVAVGTDAQFAALLQALDDPALSARTPWRSNDARVRDRLELATELDRVFSTQSRAEWIIRLESARVPCAPILNIDEALADRQIADGDLIVSTESAAGSFRTVASPLRLDGVRPAVRRGPRGFGEDSGELGFTP